MRLGSIDKDAQRPLNMTFPLGIGGQAAGIYQGIDYFQDVPRYTYQGSAPLETLDVLYPSLACFELIKRYEGLSTTRHMVDYDSQGQPLYNIGYGHRQTKQETYDSINAEQAQLLLVQDIEQVRTQLLKLVKVQLTQDQFDALISFVFQITPQKFQNTQMLQQLNRGNMSFVVTDWVRWQKVNGAPNRSLLKRRREEARLFAEPD